MDPQLRQQLENTDHSNQTVCQPLHASSLVSSTASILDSETRTRFLDIPPMSMDRSILRTALMSKRHYQRSKIAHRPISLSSMATLASLSPSSIPSARTDGEEVEQVHRSSEMARRPARPLGTCVRRCGQCQRLKHVLVAECSLCNRMMDVDLKDCRCQVRVNNNVIDHFMCSGCHGQLTLEGYIICANRTCQTTLSALMKTKSISEAQAASSVSASISDVCYPQSIYRTVAVQVHTLPSLSPLQRLSPSRSDEANVSSSSLSWPSDECHRTTDTSSASSNASRMSISSDVVDQVARNLIVGFNSNQPTKLALQSEVEHKPSDSSIRHVSPFEDAREQPSMVLLHSF